MNLSLNPELQQIIQRRIALGLYPDANAVIGDALRRTEPDDEERALREFLLPRIEAVKRGEVERVSASDFLAIARGEK